jgi:hypothetical protein
MANQKQFLHFIVSPELLTSIDEWRFKNRFATRAAAIIWLLEYALKQKPKVG